MSKLSARETRLTLETSATFRGRQIIAQIHPLTVTVREKGRRMRYEVSWEGIFVLAAKLAAERLRQERKAKNGGFVHGPQRANPR